MTTQSDIDALKATASAIAGASTTLTIQVNNLTLAGSGGGTTPPPVVPPPPTPTGTMIPVKGPRQISMQLSWMCDFIDKSYLTPRAVPWTIFADPINKILAWPPMNGQKPARIRVWNHLGNPQGLYSHFPMFDENGLSAPYEPNAGSDIAAAVNLLRRRPLPVGKRGICFASPYYSLHDHPIQRPDGSYIARAPIYTMLRHDGRFHLWMWDGLQDAGQIPGINYCTVYSVPDNDPSIFYVCDFGVPDGGTPSKWSKARIAKVERLSGRQTATSPEDASKYTVTTFHDMPGGLPVSVKTDELGNVYVADNITGWIKSITPGGAFQTIATVPGVVAMDYDAGKLVCMLNTSEVKVVDIASGAVGPNINMIPNTVSAAVPLYGSKFWTLSIDRNGTFGTRGTIFLTRDTGNGNLDAWDLEPDGAGGYKNATYSGGQGWETVGDFRTVIEVFGHYPWGRCPHRWLPLQATLGLSGTLQLLVAHKNATDAPAELPLSKYEFEISVRGSKLWQKGGPKDAPFNVPSLCCITTKEGWSPFKGCSFDEMAEYPFDATEQFVIGGMIGQFRRDNIKGDDRYCLLKRIYRNSQRFLREGQALMDAFDNWWLAKGLTVPRTVDPAGHPQTVFHAPIDDQRYIFSQAKADGSGVEMWRRDWLDSAFTGFGPPVQVPAGAVVVVDEGTPWESSVLTPGDHALTVRGAGDTRAIVVRK